MSNATSTNIALDDRNVIGGHVMSACDRKVGTSSKFLFLLSILYLGVGTRKDTNLECVSIVIFPHKTTEIKCPSKPT